MEPQVLDGKRPVRPELVCAGETMLMFVPEAPDRLSEATRYIPTAAGAESNVASWAASLGASAAWVSRVGDDPFGRFVRGQVARHAVDIEHVVVDSSRRTGMAVKEVLEERTEVHYYRQNSAASALSAADADRVRCLRPRILHLTGITAALSSSCCGFVQSLIEEPPDGTLLSFDVNWRPSLWADGDRSVLLELAGRCDVVFVGEDEAAAAWDVHTVEAVRALLPDVPTLVVKQGARGARVFAKSSEYQVSALSVDVVEAVGAGDAFAAGFLVGMLRGQAPERAARLGTLTASSALRSVADVAAFPQGISVSALLDLDDDAWQRIPLFKDGK